VAAGSKLISDPEEITHSECEAKIIVAVCVVFSRGRDSEAASNEAKQLAPEVSHYRAAIPRVERGLNLNQSTQLMGS
jgi:hypothetical protein